MDNNVIPIRRSERVTVDEARREVAYVNDVAMTSTGGTCLSLCIADENTMQIVLWGGPVLWDSIDDDRELIGVCSKCNGTGSDVSKHPISGCSNCGGGGKVLPKEPLSLHLLHTLRSLETEVGSICRALEDNLKAVT